MKRSQNSRVVVVTGASGGIGRVIAGQLAASGYAVIVHYSSNDETARELVETLRSEGKRAFAVGADLASISGIDALVAEVDRILEQNAGLELGGLVNNAALLLGPSFTEAAPYQFDRYFALNTRAPFFLAQRLAERMPPGGAIVNISSAGAHFSSPGDIVYAMSKAALESLTYNAAEALAPRGIRINTVTPGFTDNGHPALDAPGVRDYVGSFAVLGGIADPAAVANAVLFLLSEGASRTTGSSLDVTGGSTLGVRLASAGKISLRSVVGS